MLTVNRLRELLEYDPNTGDFVRLTCCGGQLVGSVAGQKSGRSQIRIDGILYMASRLAVLYMTGEWPTHEVDHKDMDYRNNRWSNLRLATRDQNQSNRKVRPGSKSGLKGVSWHSATGKWTAACQSKRARKHLGLYDCPAAAHLAYVVAAGELHSEFARVG